jgi:hypothetical protein
LRTSFESRKSRPPSKPSEDTDNPNAVSERQMLAEALKILIGVRADVGG